MNDIKQIRLEDVKGVKKGLLTELNPEEYSFLIDELKNSFNYFWNLCDENNFIFKTNEDKIFTLIGSGFSMISYIIGIKHDFIKYDDGLKKTLSLLNNLFEYIPHYEGIIAKEYQSEMDCPEFWLNDMSVFICCLTIVKEFFQKEEINIVWEKYIKRIDFSKFIFKTHGKRYLKKAYASCWKNNDNWSPIYYQKYEDQLISYFVYGGHPQAKKDYADQLYNGFERNIGSFDSHNFIFGENNPLYYHQLANLFIDFEEMIDNYGFSWHENILNATKANYAYCQKKNQNSPMWGLSLTYKNNDFIIYSAPPHHQNENYDGTISPSSLFASLNFLHKEAMDALIDLNKKTKIHGEYGMYENYCIDDDSITPLYTAFSKGITLISIENLLSKTIKDLFMQSSFFKKGRAFINFRAQ